MSALTDGNRGGYVLPFGMPCDDRHPHTCRSCGRAVERLSLFPLGRCIDCHADVTPDPTAADVVEAWGGTWHGAR